MGDFTTAQRLWLIIVNYSQMASGFALLVQVIYTWLKMRKLQTLIKFMKVLLVLVLFKSLALLSESFYMMNKDN